MVGLLLLCWCGCAVLDAMCLFVVVCCLVHVEVLIHAFAVLIAFVSCACSFWRWLASQASGVLAESQEPAFFCQRWQTQASIFFDEQANFQRFACARLASILAEKVE